MTEYAVGDRVKLARGPESKNTWPEDVPDVCYGEYVGRVAQNEVYPHRVRISNGKNRVFRDTEVSPASFATGGRVGGGKVSDFAVPDPWADHPAGYGRLVREGLPSFAALSARFCGDESLSVFCESTRSTRVRSRNSACSARASYAPCDTAMLSPS